MMPVLCIRVMVAVTGCTFQSFLPAKPGVPWGQLVPEIDTERIPHHFLH